VIKDTSGIATKRLRMSESPSLEVDRVDCDQPAERTALKRGHNAQAGLSDGQAQAPFFVFLLQDHILIEGAFRLCPGCGVVVGGNIMR